MSDLLAEVERTCRDVFADPQLVLRKDMTAADVARWDSLTHMNLVVALEKQFGIRFSTAEISRITNDGHTIGSLLELIRRKQAH